jgi:Arc/MetJ-type ribon-helix-helix transcriptional regulator
MVTLKIPRPLYERLQELIEGTGFRSVTEFATYVLRDLASHPGEPKRANRRKDTAPLTEAERAAIRERLRQLGYL